MRQIHSTELYWAVQARDGAPVDRTEDKLQMGASKIVYLDPLHKKGLQAFSKQPRQEETVFAASETFIAGYSGELLALDEESTQQKTLQHTLALALTHAGNSEPHRFVQERWLLSGDNALGRQDRAIYIQQQLPEQAPLAFDAVEMARHVDPLLSQRRTTRDVMQRLRRRVGTPHTDLYWQPGEALSTEEMLEIVQHPVLLKELRISLQYPANAVLRHLSLLRTFIFDQDGRPLHARLNRLTLWQGVMCSGVYYVAKLSDTPPIMAGDEIVLQKPLLESPATSGTYYDGTKRFVQSLANKRPLLPVSLMGETYSGERDNPEFLVRLLMRLVPLIYHADNHNREDGALVSCDVAHVKRLYWDPQARLESLSSEEVRTLAWNTLQAALPSDVLNGLPVPDWPDMGVTGISFVHLLHALRVYLDSAAYERLQRKLFQCAYINLDTMDSDVFTQTMALFKSEKREKQQQAMALVQNQTTEAAVELALQPRDFFSAQYNRNHYYQILLLGTNNVCYRDHLYYCEQPQQPVDFYRTVEETFSTQDEQVVVWQQHRQVAEQLYPRVTAFALALLQTHPSLATIERDELERAINAAGPARLSNTLRGLERQFIYQLAELHKRHLLYHFLALVRIQSRLYAMMRLLPVPQLEDQWLQKHYAEYNQLWLWACDQFVQRFRGEHIVWPPHLPAKSHRTIYCDKALHRKHRTQLLQLASVSATVSTLALQRRIYWVQTRLRDTTLRMLTETPFDAVRRLEEAVLTQGNAAVRGLIQGYQATPVGVFYKQITNSIFLGVDPVSQLECIFKVVPEREHAKHEYETYKALYHAGLMPRDGIAALLDFFLLARQRTPVTWCWCFQLERYLPLDPAVATNFAMAERRRLLLWLLRLLQKAWQALQFQHNDLKLANICYRVMPDASVQYFLIDFDKATYGGLVHLGEPGLGDNDRVRLDKMIRDLDLMEQFKQLASHDERYKAVSLDDYDYQHFIDIIEQIQV